MTTRTVAVECPNCCDPIAVNVQHEPIGDYWYCCDDKTTACQNCELSSGERETVAYDAADAAAR